MDNGSRFVKTQAISNFYNAATIVSGSHINKPFKVEYSRPSPQRPFSLALGAVQEKLYVLIYFRSKAAHGSFD